MKCVLLESTELYISGVVQCIRCAMEPVTCISAESATTWRSLEFIEVCVSGVFGKTGQ